MTCIATFCTVPSWLNDTPKLKGVLIILTLLFFFNNMKYFINITILAKRASILIFAILCLSANKLNNQKIILQICCILWRNHTKKKDIVVGFCNLNLQDYIIWHKWKFVRIWTMTASRRSKTLIKSSIEKKPLSLIILEADKTGNQNHAAKSVFFCNDQGLFHEPMNVRISFYSLWWSLLSHSFHKISYNYLSFCHAISL